MGTNRRVRVAAIQAEPVWYDREASTAKACRLIGEAGAAGASLAAFGEAWLPGYPLFVKSWPAPGLPAKYLANAVTVPGETTEQLCDAARQANTDVAIGIVELDPRTHGSVYATLLYIGREGTVLGKHRKLRPSVFEQLIWAQGDGDGLGVTARPYARISGLNCWEHVMMLPGYAIASQGTQIHVATWPTSAHLGPGRANGRLLSQAFAVQAACYVVSSAAVVTPDQVDEASRPWASTFASAKSGGSCIIAPDGTIVAEAAHQEETILVADCDLDAVLDAKAYADIGGHYSRPDVFSLSVLGPRSGELHSNAVQPTGEDASG